MVRINIPNIPYKYYELALIYVIRGRDNRVIDRSIQKFTSRAKFTKFRKLVDKVYPGLEVHEFHIRHAQEPDGKAYKAAHLWCPYCSKWGPYVNLDGYKVCEICQITTKDFYFKLYNPRYRDDVDKARIPKATPSGNKEPTSDDTKREKARLRREKRKLKKQSGGK